MPRPAIAALSSNTAYFTQSRALRKKEIFSSFRRVIRDIIDFTRVNDIKMPVIVAPPPHATFSREDAAPLKMPSVPPLILATKQRRYAEGAMAAAAVNWTCLKKLLYRSRYRDII